MSDYLLGLDNGGTLIKAVLFDTKGQALASASEATKVISPASGFNERDMEEIWTKNVQCIRGVLKKSCVDPKEIRGLAISGHGKGLYILGRQGEILYNSIMSTDNRAWMYPKQWKENGVFERNYPKLCQNILANQQLSLLAWLKEHETERYQKIGLVFSAKDYLRYRLTGEAFCEWSDLSGSALINLRDKKKDQEMLADFGIPEIYDALPPIKNSYDICGQITAEAAAQTGLAQGTPVAGGMFDIDASAVAMRVLNPNDLITITGTWSINEYISPVPVMDPQKKLMNSLYAIPGYYLIEESSATSAGNLEWYLKYYLKETDIPKGKNRYQYAEEQIQTTQTEKSDVYFLPFLYGSNTHPLAKAAFIGMTLYHSPADMLRAIFEGVAFSHKMHIDRLLTTRKAPKAIRIAGGVTKSPFWTQMFADILNYPLERVAVKEMGALGAAMAAGVAGGLFQDYEDAAEKMSCLDKTVYPNPNMHRKYQVKYEKYKKLCAALDTVWDQFTV